MFRLTKLNFKNAMMTSETLFGLGMGVMGGIFAAVIISKSADGRFDLSTVGFLPWIAGVFIVFSLTLDNDSGTVRNRLIAGYSRLRIFLAQVLSAMLLSLVYMIVSLIPVIILCHEMLSKGRTAGQLILALLVTACGYLITAATAAVFATVIFSRTGAVLSFIMFIIMAGVLSNHLIESKVYVYSAENGYPSVVVRQGIKVFALSSTVSQTYLYDEVITQDQASRIRSMEEYISEYESYAARHPGAPDSGMSGADEIRRYRATISAYKERERDLYLIPVYTLAGTALTCAAGMLIYRKRNIY